MQTWYKLQVICVYVYTACCGTVEMVVLYWVVCRYLTEYLTVQERDFRYVLMIATHATIILHVLQLNHICYNYTTSVTIKPHVL